MKTQSDPTALASTDASSKSPYNVTDDIHGLKTLFVNVFFIGQPGPGNPWVLVDAGLPGYAGSVKKRAEELFGFDNKPQAIVLTHGHFDHVGALKSLLNDWDVPVYAHRLEMPYLRGKSNYPPPDPAIGGGIMAYISWTFPISSINLGEQVKPFPENGQISELPGWRIIHTPGHAPGHVSLFRDSDRTLIAGDAFTTTDQNSPIAIATQRKEFHGPPAYFTIDWQAAQKSVEQLAALNPQAAGVGHGVSVSGVDLERGLNRLTHHFEEMAIPSAGRYVKQPAVTDENGIVNMPAPVSYNAARAIGVGLLVGLALWAFWPDGSNDDD